MQPREAIEADIRKLEFQRNAVSSVEERVMLDLLLGDRRADLAGQCAEQRSTPTCRIRS